MSECRKGIQGVSLKLVGKKATKRPSENLNKIGQIVEAIARVVSILDEQLHAGTNFYVMTDSTHFSSNGKYIPIPELMAIPPMILTLVQYTQIYGSQSISYVYALEPVTTYLIKCLVSYWLPSIAFKIHGTYELAWVFLCLSVATDLLLIIGVKLANRIIVGKRNRSKETRILRSLFSKVTIGTYCFSWPAWNIAIGVLSILIFYPLFYFGGHMRDGRFHEKILSVVFVAGLIYAVVTYWDQYNLVEMVRDVLKKAVLDFVIFDSHFYYLIEMGVLNVTMILIPNIFI